MIKRSCLRSDSRAPQTKRRVRFAEPHATAFAEALIPGPRRLALPDSPAKQARASHDPRRAQASVHASAAPTVCVPHLPFARHQALGALAAQQHAMAHVPKGAVTAAPLGKTQTEPGALEALADQLDIDLGGVVDAVEDSTLMRYGSYAVMTGGALIFVPVATLFVVSCAGLYASYWGVQQLSAIGASSARAMLGLPQASLPQSECTERESRGYSDSWPTEPYIDGHDDF